MNTLFLTPLMLVALSNAGAAVPPVPPAPPTPINPVTETLHGVSLTDNYRWLEGDNSKPDQMGTANKEVGEWTDAQNAYTRAVLDNLPGRKALEDKLRPLMEVGSVSAPRMAKDLYFYSKREGNENQARVFVRKGHNGEPRVLLDPAKIDPTGLTTISWYVPTDDGTLLAFGTYRAGDENSVAQVIEVASGKSIPINVGSKVSSFDWLPDNSGFLYRNLADVDNPYSGQVRFVALEPKSFSFLSDTLVFRAFTPEENKTLATTYGPGGGLTKDGKYLVLSYYTDTRNNDLWIASADTFRKTGKVERMPIFVDASAASNADVINNVAYITTTAGAPNGRVMSRRLDPSAASPEKAAGEMREIIPERKDAVIEGVSIAKGIIAVDYLKNASTEIQLFDFEGKSLGQLKLPGIGTASLSTDSDRTEAFLSFTSYNYPTTVFRVDLAKPASEPVLWEQPAVPVDPSSVEVKQEWYTSKDGTKVSMFIIHKKGLELDGSNPTILYGYGGFNVPLTPAFSAPLFQWFDAGGIYAVANLRGGGEYGKDWHDAGRRDKKQNVFDDFIAAAEYLIQKRYTSSPKLAVLGGSNGGLLTGAFVAQRPELAAAAISAVPLLDMVRYQSFLMARYWVPEYGSSEDPSQFKTILAYSPYHNLKKGTKYPAVMVTAGENDSRVHPLHARKFVAALRENSGSDQTTQPILLWVDREAGHGQGKPLNLRIREAADQRIFLMWQLGMLK
ncbi:MAG: prolyl oligopeptidase family serine peptidase [Phycisphaerales bacterium]|nr:prolyl oligopeptidase family serine peptidase [Phycisphaerales bacterium]